MRCKHGAGSGRTVPGPLTDAELPLTIEPKPRRLARTLVGRVEIITKQLEARVLALVRDPGAEEIARRTKASTQLRRLGIFAEPILKKSLGTGGR